MSARFAQLWCLEWRYLWQDKWLLATATLIPISVFALVAIIFSGNFARDLPVAVVDFEKSQLSRSLIRHYDASPSLKTIAYASPSDAADAMTTGKVYGMVLIPDGLSRAVASGRSAEVKAFYNSQFILVGKLVNSGLVSAQGTFSAKVEFARGLANGATTAVQAMGAAVPVRTQITPLFNSNSSYAQFLVTAIIPALWQIFIIATTVLALAGEKRRQGLESWLREGAFSALLSKLLVYQILFMLMGIGYLLWFYRIQGWPMNGSWTVLLFAQWLTLSASQAFASMFYLMAEDVSRGLSFAAAYTAPCFAFMGVTFPVTDMPLLAQWWRSLMPVSHYLEIQIAQANYGASITTAVPALWALLLLCLPFIAVLLKARSIAGRPKAGRSKAREVTP